MRTLHMLIEKLDISGKHTTFQYAEQCPSSIKALTFGQNISTTILKAVKLSFQFINKFKMQETMYEKP